jgi:hypothetical protein
MTVDELIVKLAQYPGDTVVYADSGYCEYTDPVFDIEDYLDYSTKEFKGVRILG